MESGITSSGITKRKTLYRVVFQSYDGTPFRLDTTDPDKIGPWLAEMYWLFPYMASSPTTVDIRTAEGFR